MDRIENQETQIQNKFPMNQNKILRFPNNESSIKNEDQNILSQWKNDNLISNSNKIFAKEDIRSKSKLN